MSSKKPLFLVGVVTLFLALLLLKESATIIAHASAIDPCSGGTLAYWPMDEGTGNLIQEICNSYNGSWSQGVSWATDEEGPYLQFSGSGGERITINTTALSQNTSITVELSMMPGSDRTSPLRVISQMKPSDGSGGHLRFTLDYSGSRLDVWGGTGDGWFWYCGNGKTNCLPANGWVHVAFQIDGSQVWLYYDGVLAASGSLPSPQSLRATNAITEIGCGESIYNFDGKIQYIRISQGIRNDFILTRPTTGNQSPIANAGLDQTVFINELVTLDGSGSSDQDGDPLTYAWSEEDTNPQTGILSDTISVSPNFTPSVAGTYEFTLIVNDGTADSVPDTVVIIVQTPVTVGANLAEYVPPTGSECDINVPSQYSTIQAGIDAAISGDTICVGPGTYNEDVRIYGKSIRLSGSGASSSTIIGKTTTPDQGGTVYVGAASNVIIEGFLIRGVGSDRQTGAVRIWEQVSDSIVRYNWIVAGNGENAFLTDNGQTNNLIQNNILEGDNSPMVAHVNAFDANKPTIKVDFLNNTFIGTVNPISGWDSGIVLQASGTNNLVKQNSFNITGTTKAVIAPNVTATISENNFNSSFPTKVAGPWEPSPGTVNAENNWWGDTDPSDNIFGYVDFTPFALSPFPEYPIPDWNHSPFIKTGGPYIGYEGGTVTLNGSGIDPNGDPLTFAWDLDNDGVFETTGQSAILSAVGLDGPGTQIIALQVCDDKNACDVAYTTVEILNISPSVDAGPDQTVFRNEVVSLSGTWSDPAGSQDDLYHWSWDLDGDGSPDSNGTAFYGDVIPEETSFTFEGSYTLTLRVTDKDGETGSDSLVVEVLNQAPSADAGGLYNVDEGSLITLTGSGVDPDGDPLSFVWDLDNDGVFDTPGTNPIFSAANRDGPDTQVVVLKVCDDRSACSIDQATIEITNVPPTATFENISGTVIAGDSATLLFRYQFDPGTDDTAAGFRYSYDCTNDGTFEISDSTESSYSCNYLDSGVFTAKGQIMDKDGDSTEYYVEITVLTPSEAILGLVNTVQDFNLQQGIDNGLDSKLETALQALDDVNVNNNVAAINSLEAFINAVEAQADNKISYEQAEVLVSAAQEIIDNLSTTQQ